VVGYDVLMFLRWYVSKRCSSEIRIVSCSFSVSWIEARFGFDSSNISEYGAGALRHGM
jgi:hypothetical protein